VYLRGSVADGLLQWPCLGKRVVRRELVHDLIQHLDSDSDETPRQITQKPLSTCISELCCQVIKVP